MIVQPEMTKPTYNIDRAWAILFARLVLGLIFFMAGVMKVFQLGPLNHARKYFLPFADTFLPVWSLWTMGVVIPFVELIGGALVILGLRVREALVALGFVLAVVTFGHLLRDALLLCRHSARRNLGGSIMGSFLGMGPEGERCIDDRDLERADPARPLGWFGERAWFNESRD